MGNFQGFEIHSQRLLNTNGSTFAPHECSSFSQLSPIFMHITTGQVASSPSTSMRRLC